MVYSDPYYDHPVKSCITCQKCRGFVRKAVGDDRGEPENLEWLADCAEELITQPHDSLVQYSTVCIYYEKAPTDKRSVESETARPPNVSQLEDVAQASRHVFRQMTDIAQSDGAPVIQEWGLIDRLGKALATLDRDEFPSELNRADHKIDTLAGLLRQARAYVHNDCSIGGDELIKQIDSELMSVERIKGLREKIGKYHNWMEGEAEPVNEESN